MKTTPFAKWMWCHEDTRWHVYPNQGPRYLLWVERDGGGFHTFRFEPNGAKCPVAPILLGDFLYCETPFTLVDKLHADREREKQALAEIRATRGRYLSERMKTP